MTGFADLPGHVIGFLFEYIDDPGTKRALFHATRAVRFEPSILSKYPSKLSIQLPVPENTHKYPSYLRELDLRESASGVSVLEFPRGAQLRKLTVSGWGGVPDDTSCLLSVFSPQSSTLLQDVESLVLEFKDEDLEEAQEEEDNGSAVGAALRAHCPKLRILELHGHFLSLGLLTALEECSTLEELKMYARASLPEFFVTILPEDMILSISRIDTLKRLAIPGAEAFYPLHTLKQLNWLSVGAPSADDFSHFLQGCPSLETVVMGVAPSLPVSSPHLKFLTVESMSMLSLLSFVSLASLPSLLQFRIGFLQVRPHKAIPDGLIAAAKSRLAAMPGVALEVGGLEACRMSGRQIISLLDPFANRICISWSGGMVDGVLLTKVTLVSGDIKKIASMLFPGTSSVSLIDCTLSATSLIEVAEGFCQSLVKFKWSAGPSDFKAEADQIWQALSILNARDVPCKFSLHADPQYGRGGQPKDAQQTEALVDGWRKRLAAGGKTKVCLEYVDSSSLMPDMTSDLNLSALCSDLLPALEATGSL
ncbi:hypothetical protein DUNSADRAFT_8119 [Dunaliella salina]|uniref:Uncharacterized protein n=1 Tax=Dunaliella salina TaxID=3046 RepID=A0ABQ7GJY4_DUNSA|nr:hypothetical protein DUNSADRAFT_8119 [Dunaliella salina]|eukprot:KAF5834931.1 hypothetical protein DUNSADRAFT_8119 [Dunaliella salina]